MSPAIAVACARRSAATLFRRKYYQNGSHAGFILYLTDEQVVQLQPVLEHFSEQDLLAMLDRAGSLLSGLTHGASLVLAPKSEAAIKHVEFVSLGPDRALVVLVFQDGHVENRIFRPPPGLTPSSMREAANFLNAFAAVESVRVVLRLVLSPFASPLRMIPLSDRGALALWRFRPDWWRTHRLHLAAAAAIGAIMKWAISSAVALMEPAGAMLRISKSCATYSPPSYA